jgi:hypothetical protein
MMARGPAQMSPSAELGRELTLGSGTHVTRSSRSMRPSDICEAMSHDHVNVAQALILVSASISSVLGANVLRQEGLRVSAAQLSRDALHLGEG